MIDLKQFCGKDESRSNLMEPFTRAGFTWRPGCYLQGQRINLRINP